MSDVSVDLSSDGEPVKKVEKTTETPRNDRESDDNIPSDDEKVEVNIKTKTVDHTPGSPKSETKTPTTFSTENAIDSNAPTDYETETDEEPKPDAAVAEKPVEPKTPKKSNKEKSKSRVPSKTEDKSASELSDNSFVEVSYINHKGRTKTKKQLERERAFKKLDLADNDPVLVDHRQNRRQLAERLENDPEFRAAYIAEEERKRLEEEQSSVIDSDDINDAIRRVHKLQGVDDSITENDSESESVHLKKRNTKNHGIADGISHDGSVDFSLESSDFTTEKKKKKKKKNKEPKRAGIYINKLIIKKMVLKL